MPYRSQGITACLVRVTVMLALAAGMSGRTFALSERGFSEAYDQVIVPFVNETAVRSSFRGVDGVEVRFASYPRTDAKAIVLIVPGRTEAASKYDELAYDLHHEGYGVYVIDHRGQGRSGRLVNGSDVGHVARFHDYAADGLTLVHLIRAAHPTLPLYGLAHSMGANILLTMLLDEPRAVDRGVVVAPMLSINLGGVPDWLAFGLCRAATWLGLGSTYAPTQGPYDPGEINRVTTSSSRYEKHVALRNAAPAQIVGGASMSWLAEGIRASWDVTRRADEVVAPLLMLQAGRDFFVLDDGQNEFCSHAKFCRKVVFPQAMHEILQETDAIRERALDEIFRFFERRDVSVAD